MSGGRDIFRHARYARNEVREVLQSIFVAELLRPSSEIWVVSPWLSDIEVIADTTGAFSILAGGMSGGTLSLASGLVHLARAGARVRVVTRPGASDGFRGALDRQVANHQDATDNIQWREVASLHTKGLLGDEYRLMGSMNFTFNGVEINEEALLFDRDLEAVSRTRLQFEREYG